MAWFKFNKSKKKKPVVQKSAIQRVFSTYELLEPILLYLRSNDVRNARLTSRTFNEVITRSQALDAEWKWSVQKQPRVMQTVFFGDVDSGKRSLMEKWVVNIFAHDFDPTLEDCLRKQILIDGERWRMDVNTVSANDTVYFQTSLFSMSLREADCYALVYSATSRSTFASIRGWQRKITEEQADSPYEKKACLAAIVATKCDLEEQREVSIAEGKALAKDLGCGFLETSATSGHNVDRVFEVIGARCRDDIKIQTVQDVPSYLELKDSTTGRRRSSVNQGFKSIQRKFVGSSSRGK